MTRRRRTERRVVERDEKAQKHMDKRTVVVGEDNRDRTVGVITKKPRV